MKLSIRTLKNSTKLTATFNGLKISVKLNTPLYREHGIRTALEYKKLTYLSKSSSPEVKFKLIAIEALLDALPC